MHSIRLGAQTNVQDCAVLHGMRYLYPVIVGEMVTIGHNATVHGCVLEDAVLVGIGATILNNARIGEGSIIAAGAVIPEQTVIPPNSLVPGVPDSVPRVRPVRGSRDDTKESTPRLACTRAPRARASLRYV